MSLVELQLATVATLVIAVIALFIVGAKLPRAPWVEVPECAAAAGPRQDAATDGRWRQSCPDSADHATPAGGVRGADGGHGGGRVDADAGPARAWTFEHRSSWGWWVLLGLCGALTIPAAVVALRDRRDELAAGLDVAWSETLGRAAMIALLMGLPLCLVFVPVLWFTGSVDVKEDGTVHWGANVGRAATRPAAAAVAVVAEAGEVRIVLRGEEGELFALRLPRGEPGEAVALAARLRNRIARGAGR